MAVTDHELKNAEQRMGALRETAHAVSARYDRRKARIAIELSSGIEVAFPVRMVQGLAHATAAQLGDIDITPAGLGLHWPRLDADVYLPALLQGVFGTKRWMASKLGAAGGQKRSAAKARSARENGRKGGRPRKSARG